MDARKVKLLHIEDEESQRWILAHHLRSLGEFDFEILYAGAEAEALALFDKGGVDLVLLDYQLSGGNGLSCLEALRQRDPLVPIIAISGVATNEVAEQLVRAGADDYIDKHELTLKRFVGCVRDSLERYEAWRRQAIRKDQCRHQGELRFSPNGQSAQGAS